MYKKKIELELAIIAFILPQMDPEHIIVYLISCILTIEAIR